MNISFLASIRMQFGIVKPASVLQPLQQRICSPVCECVMSTAGGRGFHTVYYRLARSKPRT